MYVRSTHAHCFQFLGSLDKALLYSLLHSLLHSLLTAGGVTSFPPFPFAHLFGIFQGMRIVAIVAYRGIILYALVAGERTYLGYLGQTLEYRVFGCPRQSVECFHMLQYINPTFKIIGAFLRLLLKVWQLEEYHSHIPGEQLAFLYVHQRDIRAELLANVVEAEVQETHEIHGADAISPVHAPLALTRYGFRRIIDAALLKVWLLAVLHLHDDVFAAVGLAEDTVTQRATVLELCGLLLVKERNLLNHALAFEQVVQKIQQEGAGQFLTEDALETYIGKRVDVFAHDIIAFNSANLHKIYGKTSKNWKINAM